MKGTQREERVIPPLETLPPRCAQSSQGIVIGCRQQSGHDQEGTDARVIREAEEVVANGKQVMLVAAVDIVEPWPSTQVHELSDRRVQNAQPTAQIPKSRRKSLETGLGFLRNKFQGPSKSVAARSSRAG